MASEMFLFSLKLITILRSSRDIPKPTTCFQGLYSLNFTPQLKDDRTYHVIQGREVPA